MIVVSYSGNTLELSSMLKFANRFGIKIIGCASKKESMLLKASDVKILLPKVKEADNWYGAYIFNDTYIIIF